MNVYICIKELSNHKRCCEASIRKFVLHYNFLGTINIENLITRANIKALMSK